LLFQKVTIWPLTCSQELLVPVPGMQMSRSTAHAAVPAAFACDAARAVAAAHQAFTRARRVGAPVPLDGVAGSLRIVRAVAAGADLKNVGVRSRKWTSLNLLIF
jgi:hypothetical protein